MTIAIITSAIFLLLIVVLTCYLYGPVKAMLILMIPVLLTSLALFLIKKQKPTTNH